MDTKQHPDWQKRGALGGGILYIDPAFTPSPFCSSLRLVAKLGPGNVRDKVSILLTSRRLKVYLGEMKNQE